MTPPVLARHPAETAGDNGTDTPLYRHPPFGRRSVSGFSLWSSPYSMLAGRFTGSIEMSFCCRLCIIVLDFLMLMMSALAFDVCQEPVGHCDVENLFEMFHRGGGL